MLNFKKHCISRLFFQNDLQHTTKHFFIDNKILLGETNLKAINFCNNKFKISKGEYSKGLAQR